MSVWRNLSRMTVVSALALATASCDPGDEPILLAQGPTPAPQAADDHVDGTVSGGNGAPGVSVVLIDPDLPGFSLNAPAPDGSTPARFPSSRALSATVWLNDGSKDAQGVTWSSSAPQAVQVSPQGLVSVMPGASGSAVVTATSARNPLMSDDLIVSVTTVGKLRLSVYPTLQGSEEETAQTTLDIIQNGALIDRQAMTNELDLLLAAGTYRLEIVRTGTGPTLSWSSGGVQVTSNGVTPIAAQLQ